MKNKFISFLGIGKRKVSEFFSNHTLPAALDNLMAMFPSTILMPIVINNSVGYQLFDISLVLFLSGVATLFYLAYTQGRLPGYLGSSFAYIGVTVYIVSMAASEGVPQEEQISYVIGAYLLVGIYLLALSLLCKIGGNKSNAKIKKVINFFMPAAVMGPALSLIGLELSGDAISQSGLSTGLDINSGGLALITIGVIIFVSVTRFKFFKKSSIVPGVLIAGLIAIIIGQWDLKSIFSAPVVQAPAFNVAVPKFSWRTAIAIFPPTLILFSEHIGRKIMIENLRTGFFKNKVSIVKPKEATLFRSLSGNAFANIISGAFCGVPLTLYAENVGVMRINNDTRSNQFFLCAVLVIFLSFSGNLLELVRSIPDPILGGLTLVLMGLIAAPGIQILVEEKVDYTKITNLLLTASVLIVGLSEMSINVAGTHITGMSLGLLVGIIMNLFFKLLGLLNITYDHMGFEELIKYCKNMDQNKKISFRIFDNDTEAELFYCNNKFIRISNDADAVRITIRTNIQDDECLRVLKHKQAEGWVALEVDGTFKDKKILELINKSFRIIKAEYIKSLHLRLNKGTWKPKQKQINKQTENQKSEINSND